MHAIFEGYLAQKEAITASVNRPPISFGDQMAGLYSSPGGLDTYRFQLQSVRAGQTKSSRLPKPRC